MLSFFKADPDTQHLTSLHLFDQSFENRFYGCFKYQSRKDIFKNLLYISYWYL